MRPRSAILTVLACLLFAGLALLAQQPPTCRQHLLKLLPRARQVALLI